jgi:hypothetical protein
MYIFNDGGLARVTRYAVAPGQHGQRIERFQSSRKEPDLAPVLVCGVVRSEQQEGPGMLESLSRMGDSPAKEPNLEA